ncbi:MAG: hypothetical protein PHH83_02715 [Patescibacteria group bacterium]|nr:hypothetical protein [Patescibacteria group bacterium]
MAGKLYKKVSIITKTVATGTIKKIALKIVLSFERKIKKVINKIITIKQKRIKLGNQYQFISGFMVTKIFTSFETLK